MLQISFKINNEFIDKYRVEFFDHEIFSLIKYYIICHKHTLRPCEDKFHGYQIAVRFL